MQVLSLCLACLAYISACLSPPQQGCLNCTSPRWLSDFPFLLTFSSSEHMAWPSLKGLDRPWLTLLFLSLHYSPFTPGPLSQDPGVHRVCFFPPMLTFVEVLGQTVHFFCGTVVAKLLRFQANMVTWLLWPRGVAVANYPTSSPLQCLCRCGLLGQQHPLETC